MSWTVYPPMDATSLGLVATEGPLLADYLTIIIGKPGFTGELSNYTTNMYFHAQPFLYLFPA